MTGIGFFLVWRDEGANVHYVLADRLVRSVQAVMPQVPIVQLTDETSPEVYGVSAALRRPSKAPLLQQRIEHYAACFGEWCLVDTDIYFQRSIESVFKNRYDVALTNRNWGHVDRLPKLEALMPFNTGIVWTRCPAFWAQVKDVWVSYPEHERDWMSEQRAVADVVRTDKYRIRVLSGRKYNYPPNPEGKNRGITRAYVIHDKGHARKQKAIADLRGAA